jgi:single-strand DNA-binding protein
LADVVERYVKKGDRLYVEGRIEYREWQGRDGQTRYTTEINVREMIMLSSPRGGDSGEGAARVRAEAGRTGAADEGDEFEDFPGVLEDGEDDLPF